jgi:hypothetical protein
MADNILKFERRESKAKISSVKVSGWVKKPRFFLWQGFVKTIWVFTVLLWPVVSWIIALDCLFQLIRMLYYWNTPHIYAGWTFILHFSVLTALSFFVMTVPYDKKKEAP